LLEDRESDRNKLDWSLAIQTQLDAYALTGWKG